MIALLAWSGPAAAQEGPSPAASDAAITDAVESEFLFDTIVPLHEIDIATSEGVVTLSGSVDNLRQKRRAERMAETVRGVTDVENHLVVEVVTGMTAANLLDDVEKALLWDPATESYEIGVGATANGVVTLNGTVDSYAEKMLAETVAAGVRGVTKVNNEIIVEYDEDRPDAEILEDVRGSLERDAQVDATRIDATVVDGKVTLTGTVDSAIERTEARLDAWVYGVDAVDTTGLMVAPDGDRGRTMPADWSDTETRDAIVEGLVWDPRVASFEVSVMVDDGVATLRGTVDNLKAKRAAESVADTTLGVRRVRNMLRVEVPGEMAQWSENRIANRIEDALALDPHVESYEIDVTVEDGVARLTGTVDTWFERGQADDVAARTMGVVAVDNDLFVDRDHVRIVYDPYLDLWDVDVYDWYVWQPYYPTQSDAEIREDIEDELFWSPFVDSDEVTVTVDDGVARLTGTVDSWSEFDSATENAYEGGAVWVDNDLDVE